MFQKLSELYIHRRVASFPLSRLSITINWQEYFIMWVSRILFYADLDSGKLARHMIYDTMDLLCYFVYITVEVLKAYILSVGSLQVMWTKKKKDTTDSKDCSFDPSSFPASARCLDIPTRHLCKNTPLGPTRLLSLEEYS